jgi:hypothetical protein
MHEALEGHGGYGGNEKGPDYASYRTSSIRGAGCHETLLDTAPTLNNCSCKARASDQWAYFQAKNIRLRETQSVADILGALAPPIRKKTAALHEKYLTEVERYEKEKIRSVNKPDFEKERPGATSRGSLRCGRSFP